jgi:hypothetical protein
VVSLQHYQLNKNNTLTIMKYTREQIQETMEGLGHSYFTNGNYNVNIICIRNSYTKSKVTDKFDDLITLSYKKNGEWKYFEWDSTTDPGKHWMENPMNTLGTAILVPGQYRGSHIIRKHQGRYNALGQDRPVKVFRDNNKDLIYDENTITEGLYGINIHKAGDNSRIIHNWSAGCQVFKKDDDFYTFMGKINKSRELYGNRFTVTLIESSRICW